MKFATTTRTQPTPATIEEFVDGFDCTRPTLLAVWAHPDDESYLGGGLIAEIAQRGGRVVVVSATLGEHGTQDPQLNPPAQLARLRERELAAALSTLGVAETTCLGYADGSCEQVADAMGASRIKQVIAHVEPDVILTFGSDGVTGHPDHKAVARWTELAVSDLGDDIPLIATAAGAAWPAPLVERMHEIGAFWPEYPDRIVHDHHWPIRLEGERLEQKLAALACHKSQVGPLLDVLGPAGYRQLATAEGYRPSNLSALSMVAGTSLLVSA